MSYAENAEKGYMKDENEFCGVNLQCDIKYQVTALANQQAHAWLFAAI